MGITHDNILDLVATTVKHICPDKTPSVRLSGNNIFIGNKPMSIYDINTNTHSTQGFLKFIKEAM